MALFTDSDVVTLDDLLPFEGSLVQVSSTHGIDVQAKIKLATDEIGDRLMLNLLRAGLSDPQWLNRAKIGLSTVVVTPLLFRWLCFDSLARVYAEAYNVQLNTRFQAKWNEYQQQSDAASELCLTSGIGVVLNPLPRPAIPTISSGAGSFQATSIFAQATWVDRLGNESAPSPINGMILNGSASVQVSMAGTSSQAPIAAVGWNVYVSTSQGGLALQNSSPVAIGSPWQMPNSSLIAGVSPSNGQIPDVTVACIRRWQRG
ncbi:MAG: hypothetical protein JOZ45_00775 [Acidobacteriaceae bacterium]|nr:hypothetical protein [Acidobacteriaceae bacterium]